MSLTQSDLQEIRTIVRDEVDTIVTSKIEPLQNEIKALRKDIKEIYGMFTVLHGRVITDKKFEKLSLEDKLLTINAELVVAAKQAGITLPRT